MLGFQMLICECSGRWVPFFYFFVNEFYNCYQKHHYLLPVIFTLLFSSSVAIMTTAFYTSIPYLYIHYHCSHHHYHHIDYYHHYHVLFFHEYHYHLFRSSRLEVFCKKGVLKNFAKFARKHLCQSLFFNKVSGLRSATLLKTRVWHRCFLVNFAKFLRTPFLTERLWWLLLPFYFTSNTISTIIIPISTFNIIITSATFTSTTTTPVQPPLAPLP